MTNQRPDKIKDFNVAHVALRDTECMANPADSSDSHKGLVRKGELVWFHADHCGSGPAWLQARLPNQTLCYVHLHDFEKLDRTETDYKASRHNPYTSL